MYAEFQGSRPKNGVNDEKWVPLLGKGVNGAPYFGEGVLLGSKMCYCPLWGSKSA